MPSVILDAFGKPAQQMGGGGALYARTEADARLRPPKLWHFDDYISLLSSGRWRMLLSESRAVASRGLVSAAADQKADYVSASHWRPYFTGEDGEYGDEAEMLLEDTSALCCTRGPRFDWRTFWRIGVLSCISDGSFFVLLTSNADGWPLLQPIEAHRIGQRGGGGNTVMPGSAFTTIKKDDGTTDRITTPYEDLKIVNGVIYNKAGAEVAFRVLGPTPGEDEDISARDMIHVGAPRWFSEGRPIPQLAPALLDLMGVDLARTAQLDQQILDSRLTFVEKNATGKRDPVKDLVNPPFTPPTNAGTMPEITERGAYRYVKANGDLSAHQSSRPSDQWMNFDMRTAATALAAIRWRIEMLDPAGMKGAATHAFMDQINTSIMNTFQDFRHAAKRANIYRVAKFTQIGVLPDHKEFLRWDITPPPEFVVDRNSMRSEIEAVRAGAESMPNLLRKGGHRARHTLTEQAKYVFLKKKTARDFSTDGIEVKPEELGDMSVPGDAVSASANAEAKAAQQTEPAAA